QSALSRADDALSRMAACGRTEEVPVAGPRIQAAALGVALVRAELPLGMLNLELAVVAPRLGAAAVALHVGALPRVLPATALRGPRAPPRAVPVPALRILLASVARGREGLAARLAATL